MSGHLSLTFRGMANPSNQRHHEDKLGRMHSAQRLGWLSLSYSLTLATILNGAQGKRGAW